jgi:hypothetical protein
MFPATGKLAKIGRGRDIKLSNVDLQKRETGAINIICGIVSRDSVIEQVPAASSRKIS